MTYIQANIELHVVDIPSLSRFVWQLIGVSLFYLLPAFQLVIAYQKFLDISGNQDLCFYNHLCSWPISIVR